MNEHRNILVTGANGFIGSYIVRLLIASGYSVITPVRQNSDLTLLNDVLDKINLHRIDMQDLFVWQTLLEKSDAVIHSAAVTSLKTSDPHEMIAVNLEFTRMLVDVALQTSIKKFVFISSIAALGWSDKKEMLSEEDGWDDSFDRSQYGHSKYLAELEVRRAEAEGLNITILNPALVLGAGIWREGTPSIFSKLDGFVPFMPTGSNGFVDVRDVADAAVKSLHLEDVNGHRFIIAADNYPLREIFNQIRHILGRASVDRRLSGITAFAVRLLDGLSSFFLRRPRNMNKDALNTMSANKIYNNSKSKSLLQMKYRPVKASVQEIADLYISSKKNNKNYALLPF